MMITELSVQEIAESKSNPRKIYRDHEELVESVKRFGILQPLTARPRDNAHELVFGHRRLRAAKDAGLTTVPVIVKTMTDEQVLEAQLVENVQRDDIHPLEESDAYRELVEKYDRTAEEIADKVGRSKAYVYARLRYSSLCTEARDLFLGGKLTPTTALLLTRIPTPDQQAKAAAEISDEAGDGPMSLRQARFHITNSYMLKLQSAPFKTDDAELVADAGACGTCPKRTGNQGELFDDVDAPDLCTDVDCFNTKRDAAWAITKAQAKERGLIIIDSKKNARELFYFGKLLAGAAYIELSDKCTDDPKRQTYRALLTDSPVQRFMARDEGGGVHELVERKVLKNALVDAGHTFARDAKGETSLQAERRKERAKVELERRAAVAIGTQVVAKVNALELGGTDDFWRLVARSAIRSTFPEKHKAVAARRGILDKKDTPENVLFNQANILKGGALRALALEMVFSPGLVAKGTSLHEAAEHFGLDVKTVRTDLRKEQREAEQTKRKKKAGGKKKKAGTKKRAAKGKTSKTSKKAKGKTRGKRSKKGAAAATGNTDDNQPRRERRAS